MPTVLSTGANTIAAPVAAEPPGPRKGDGHEARPDAGAAFTSVAFDALLDVTGALMRAGRGGGSDKTSPAQMFEPNVADARERRQAALKEEYRSERANGSRDDRLDRTSVQARRADAGRTASQPHDTRLQPATERTHSLSDRAGTESSRSDSRVGLLTGDGAAAPRGRAALSAADIRSNFRGAPAPVAAGSTGVHASSVAPGPADALDRLESRSHRISGSHRVTPTGSSSELQTRGETVARQVARLLGAGRVGEVESARAEARSPATTDTRQSAFDQKATTRASARGQTTANRSLGHTGGADVRVDAAAQSPFDQLVRSIRLQAGARYSSARLHLHPPELGRLRVDVRVAGEQLQIDVRTETAAARELMHERAAQLTAALEQHGIYVERFTVASDLLDGDPSASPDGNGSEAGLNQGRGKQPEGLPPRTGGVPSEGIGVSTASEAEPDTTAVKKTRLDIRV